MKYLFLILLSTSPAPFTFSVDYSISSSGMNGARLLQQRTLGDDICKIRRLGRGSFGDVWLGKLPYCKDMTLILYMGAYFMDQYYSLMVFLTELRLRTIRRK